MIRNYDILSKHGKTMHINKGIFWFIPQTKELIAKKVACDRNGNATENVDYSSKSGTNFNHKIEWDRFPNKITNRKPYNYYPRGRVEIKKGKVLVYLNPALRTYAIEKMIINEFFGDADVNIRFVADNSSHYDCQFDKH